MESGELGPQAKSVKSARAKSARCPANFYTNLVNKVGPYPNTSPSQDPARNAQEYVLREKMSTFSLTRSRGKYLRVVGILEMVE